MNQITSPLQPGMKGSTVADLQDALQLLIGRQLIKTFAPPNRPTADELQKLVQGLNQERVQSTYGAATQQLVRYFQNQNGLGDSFAGSVEAKTAQVLNRALTGLGAFTASLIYVVSGRVYSANSAGVGGLLVQAIDKNVGPDVQLAAGLSDGMGRYTLTYPPAIVTTQGKSAPDIQVRVLSGGILLGTSEVHYNATSNETLDVHLPDTAGGMLPAEHDTLTSALAMYHPGNLADLQESSERSDITFLANKSGWDARAVALAALAGQFSVKTIQPTGAGPTIDPAFFYALFRAGLPANEDLLYQTDAAMLTTVWTKAVEQGVISRSLTSSIPEIVKQFQVLSARKLLTAPALTGVSSLQQMISSRLATDAQRQQFAALYTANRSDMTAFWQSVGDAFGNDTANHLQVDGKLGLLTINNAGLMQKVHATVGTNGLSDPRQLAQLGYYRADSWSRLLTSDVPIPNEIPGDTTAGKQANYAEYLAAQVRLSYPTAALAHMVKSGELVLTDAPQGIPEQVSTFLTTYQDNFDIGMHPVEQFIKNNNIPDAPVAVVAQVKRLQRVNQITPSDKAMTGLMKRGIDSAYHIVRYDRDAFIRGFSADLGGAGDAALTYDKSVQIHNAVLNTVVTYLNSRTAPAIGVHGPANVLDPAPANTGDIIAYATLESLFGSMDFCTCDECRSILSPAAYLVDLLLFLHSDEQEWRDFCINWRSVHGGAPYPYPDQAVWNSANSPQDTEISPVNVLLSRRPDIEHLPLTCENTNTALPYIDMVNETLEYFIANSNQKLSLNGYLGHDTDSIASEDLLASPQFVMDSAYTTLRNERFPIPLPFHQPLENLRRYFDKFEVPLPLVMERLRKTDDLERGANPYGRRDILMEEIGLSRAEYEIYTDSTAVPFWRMYGFPDGMADTDVIAGLSNAKQFARRVGITYADLVSVLKMRFINPNFDLVPKLERLGVPFDILKALKDGTITDAAFDALLPTDLSAPDPAEYGGDIKTWVKRQDNYDRIMGLITLADPTQNPDPCNFDNLQFRYSDPAKIAQNISAAEFVRLLYFIRLWRKMGWTIEQTDAAIRVLYRADMTPLEASDIDAVAKLNSGFLTLLPRLGIVSRVVTALNLAVNSDLLPLLACWSEIDVYGDAALYRQMFLSPALLAQDAVFADNGYGEFLTDTTKKLADHAEALRSAFNLTGDEYERIISVLGYDAGTDLTIRNISAIYRRGWLARKLKLSVRELLLLIQLTGLDPFAVPDPTQPAILRIISLIQALKARSLKTATALYLLWNQDLSGKSMPDLTKISALARTLRLGLAEVETGFAVVDDPDGSITQAQLAKVYGPDTAAFFFGLINDTLTVEVEFSDPDGTFAVDGTRQAIDNAAGKTDAGVQRIAYDQFRKQLSYSGVLAPATRDAIDSAAGAGNAAFKTAMDNLYGSNQTVISPFFARYPELQSPYNAYASDNVHPVSEKRNILLQAILPDLVNRRKRQQTLQAVCATADTDPDFTQSLIDPPSAPFALHAAGHSDQPAMNEFLGVETPGLSVEFFASDTATGATISSPDIAANLDYTPLINGTGNPLPANPTPGSAISGVWNGYLEAPDSGFFDLHIETDAGTSVTLILDSKPVTLVQNATLWNNADPIELRAGSLYSMTLTVEKVRNVVRVQWQWEPKGQGCVVIPARYLYPAVPFAAFREAYIRFLKVSALAAGLGLTGNETAFFATNSDYYINADGWLNALAVSGTPATDTASALLKPLESLLDFAGIKAEVSPGEESLLTALKDPTATTQNADSLLYSITRWNQTDLNDVLALFNSNIAGLGHFEMLHRVYDAFALIRKMGISAKTLILATTNEPADNIVRDLQAALRARYDATGWRDVVKPINDEMRSRQRDALVAYILHQMLSHPESANIDTPDKLFEYFLMDVQMDPCMQTSRIRNALSSVQVFIERCLMNLEPRVSSETINPKQWEWMKRYRVWEANRKVYLFPENWLEPELRDDKSPFFKEIESELLQSDITDDSAATALLNYLAKLEEVAKLEPCGIFHIPADPVKHTGGIDHVVARTAGAHRKYYYRKYNSGSWTPWEQIKLDIEDNPVIPVVWNDRLLLFWLRILKKGPDIVQKPFSKEDNLTSLKTSDIKTDPPQVTIQAVLCWSENYNGKWQNTKTSDVSKPVSLGSISPFAFDRSTMMMKSHLTQDGQLMITIYGNGSVQAFLLYNTHSLPLPTPMDFSTLFAKNRGFGTAGSTFRVSYRNTIFPVPFYIPMYRDLLTEQIPMTTVQPNHDIPDTWDAPFFFEDSRNVFYVTTEEQQVWIRNFGGYGILVNPGVLETAQIPPLVVQTAPQPKPKSWDDGGSTGTDQGVIDPAPMQQFVTEDAYIRQGIGSSGLVTFGDLQIGPSGAIPNIIEKKG